MVKYELKTPFQYSHEGELLQAQFIELKAPNYKQLNAVAPLKQAFMRAMADAMSMYDVDGEKSKKEFSEKENVGKMEARFAMTVLYSGSGDAAKALLHASELFKTGLALIDGTATLKASNLDSISGEDFEGLVGEYIVNFIQPSLTGQ